LAQIALRKLDMVSRLFFLSVGPAVVLVALGVFSYALWGRQGWLQSWRRQSDTFFKVIGAMIGGAVVGLLTNDSGIVVAAFLFMFAVIPTLLLGLEKQNGASPVGDTPDVTETASATDSTERV
jgi:hypothetical protein